MRKSAVGDSTANGLGAQPELFGGGRDRDPVRSPARGDLHTGIRSWVRLVGRGGSTEAAAGALGLDFDDVRFYACAGAYVIRRPRQHGLALACSSQSNVAVVSSAMPALLSTIGDLVADAATGESPSTGPRASRADRRVRCRSGQRVGRQASHLMLLS
jgi:hypothetical protein